MRSRDQDHSDQYGKTPSLPRIQKLAGVWWCMPVVPASREAEAGESLEPRDKHLFHIVLEAMTSKIKAPADLVSGEGPPFWFVVGHLVLSSHG